MYDIHSDIPLPPPARRGSASRRKYPFEGMAVGDMFFAPDKDPEVLSTWVARVNKKLNRTFVVRTVWMREERGELVLCDERATGARKGAGVWRTA